MAPPVAPSASLHEPQQAATVASSLPPPPSSLIDQLPFFDAFGCKAASSTPHGATALSSAHDALMAFLTEMDALDQDSDDEQQSNCGSTSDSETTTATSTTESTISSAAEDGPPAVCSAAESSDATAATTANCIAKPVEKKRRIRAKHEIDMLREDAAALQHQLEMLQSTATYKQRREAEREANAVASNSSKKPKLRHVGAVEQNRQLRKLVRSQLRYSKQIEKALKRITPHREERSMLISDNLVTKTPLSKADLVVFYEALTGKLDALYAQLDSVFADAGKQDSQQFNDVKLVIGDNKRATLQLRDRKTLPFGFERVKDVSWRILKDQGMKKGDGADELLVADENVLLMRRGLKVQLEEGEPEVDIPMRAVSKRFLSKDRVVICWDGTTDWPAPPQAALDQPQSLLLREKGWAVTKPVPGNPGLSTMQMCILMTPEHSDERVLETVTKEELREGITKFVIPTYQQLFSSRYQMIENMLLDQQER